MCLIITPFQAFDDCTKNGEIENKGKEHQPMAGTRPL